jgi:hypothetical protein
MGPTKRLSLIASTAAIRELRMMTNGEPVNIWAARILSMRFANAAAMKIQPTTKREWTVSGKWFTR